MLEPTFLEGTTLVYLPKRRDAQSSLSLEVAVAVSRVLWQTGLQVLGLFKPRPKESSLTHKLTVWVTTRDA